MIKSVKNLGECKENKKNKKDQRKIQNGGFLVDIKNMIRLLLNLSESFSIPPIYRLH